MLPTNNAITRVSGSEVTTSFPLCTPPVCYFAAVDFTVDYSYSGSPAGAYVGVSVQPSSADGTELPTFHIMPVPSISAGVGEATERVVWDANSLGDSTTTDYVHVCMYANPAGGGYGPEFACVVVSFHHTWVANFHD